jgi:hypothetical protein
VLDEGRARDRKKNGRRKKDRSRIEGKEKIHRRGNSKGRNQRKKERKKA